MSEISCDVKKLNIKDSFIRNELIKIGEGNYSNIYSFNSKYAIKIMKIKFCNYLDNVSEISILNSTKNKENNLINYYGLTFYDGYLSLILEKVDISLNNFKIISEIDKISIIDQLYNGLFYLHEKKYLHLDLCPNNILIKIVNDIPIVKICDFSLSCKTFDLTFKSKKQLISTFYRPYENLKGSDLYSYKSDLWSLGIIIFEITNSIKITDIIPFVTINSEYNDEISLILFIEKNIAWKKWPLDNINLLSINPNFRKHKEKLISTQKIEYNKESVLCKKFNNINFSLYQIETDRLYLLILDLMKTKKDLIIDDWYISCFAIIYSLYNYHDYILSILPIDKLYPISEILEFTGGKF
jgi:serine/threonine protein kinase